MNRFRRPCAPSSCRALKSACFLPAALAAGLLFTALSPAPAVAQSKGSGTSCAALLQNRPPSGGAEKALWADDWTAAASQYQALLASHPNDPAIVAGLTRSYLGGWKNADAAAVVATAHAADSKSAILLTAAGEVTARLGNVPAAWKLFVAAIQQDVCYARAHYDMYRLMKLSSLHSSAYKQLKVAYQLDPSDPDIYWAWQSTLPLKDRIGTVMHEIGSSVASDGDKASARQNLEYLQTEEEAARHHCHLVAPVDKTQISMTPHYNDLGEMGDWALDMSINKQAPVRLIIDTGASGILINRIAAEHAGLKPVLSTKVGGIGDQGPVGGYLAYADTLKIGGMEFADCPVVVGDRRSLAGSSGLIGMDVFQDFMVTLDYPLRKFSLGALPKRGATASAPPELNSNPDAQKSDTERFDSYDGPEVADFVPIYIAGDSKLLLNTTLNQASDKLMVIDTGASTDAVFNSRVAPQFVKVTQDNSLRDSERGISGKVAKVSTVSFVTMRYGKNLQMHLGGDSAIDLDPTSRDVGMEVAGLLGAGGLYQLLIDIDYRDGLIRFRYDRKHGSNAW